MNPTILIYKLCCANFFLDKGLQSLRRISNIIFGKSGLSIYSPKRLGTCHTYLGISEAIATPTSYTNGPSAMSSQDYMTLAEADIYAIKPLSSRVNVLPVISRADTMTNERLEEVKAVIRQDFKKDGVQVGNILGQLDNSESEDDEEEGGGRRGGAWAANRGSHPTHKRNV